MDAVTLLTLAAKTARHCEPRGASTVKEIVLCHVGFPIDIQIRMMKNPGKASLPPLKGQNQ